jgi:hypothetical protein
MLDRRGDHYIMILVAMSHMRALQTLETDARAFKRAGGTLDRPRGRSF